MNKALRHEKKMLKYKKRLKKYGLKEATNSNLYAFRSHGAPCSCPMCSYAKYSKTERQEAKATIHRELQELVD